MAVTAPRARCPRSASSTATRSLAGLAVAFVVAGVGIWRGSAWAVASTVTAAVVSLVACALGSPAAAAGLVVNAVVLIADGHERAWVIGRSAERFRPR